MPGAKRWISCGLGARIFAQGLAQFAQIGARMDVDAGKAAAGLDDDRPAMALHEGVSILGAAKRRGFQLCDAQLARQPRHGQFVGRAPVPLRIAERCGDQRLHRRVDHCFPVQGMQPAHAALVAGQQDIGGESVDRGDEFVVLRCGIVAESIAPCDEARVVEQAARDSKAGDGRAVFGQRARQPWRLLPQRRQRDDHYPHEIPRKATPARPWLRATSPRASAGNDSIYSITLAIGLRAWRGLSVSTSGEVGNAQDSSKANSA